MAKVPDSVPADEKVWFALTAYNIGYGHMMDARRLTKELGKNPDAWSDVKEVLPCCSSHAGIARCAMAMPVAARRATMSTTCASTTRACSGSTTNSRRPIVARSWTRTTAASRTCQHSVRPSSPKWSNRSSPLASPGCVFLPCSLLPSLGIRGALERTYCNVFIALQFLPKGPFGPTQDQGGEQDASTQKSHIGPKTKCAWSPRRKLKLADMKRKIWHRNRSFTLLIAEHISINPASAGFFIMSQLYQSD